MVNSQSVFTKKTAIVATATAIVATTAATANLTEVNALNMMGTSEPSDFHMRGDDAFPGHAFSGHAKGHTSDAGHTSNASHRARRPHGARRLHGARRPHMDMSQAKG